MTLLRERAHEVVERSLARTSYRRAKLVSQHAPYMRRTHASSRPHSRRSAERSRAEARNHEGGTDGAVLSSLGLPTPNLFTGGQEYHSVREWASVQDMAAAAATIVELAGVWAEPES